MAIHNGLDASDDDMAVPNAMAVLPLPFWIKNNKIWVFLLDRCSMGV
jgi:hypothetical protein